MGAEKSYIFKHCPTTSCDVERSFSSYKTILEEKRQNFLVENTKRYLVIYFYYLLINKNLKLFRYKLALKFTYCLVFS
jgi:hypothetical protein